VFFVCILILHLGQHPLLQVAFGIGPPVHVGSVPGARGGQIPVVVVQTHPVITAVIGKVYGGIGLISRNLIKIAVVCTVQIDIQPVIAVNDRFDGLVIIVRGEDPLLLVGAAVTPQDHIIPLSYISLLY